MLIQLGQQSAKRLNPLRRRGKLSSPRNLAVDPVLGQPLADEVRALGGPEVVERAGEDGVVLLPDGQLEAVEEVPAAPRRGPASPRREKPREG
eukprot:6684760-Alexandrium_andersonii.AAC.1